MHRVNHVLAMAHRSQEGTESLIHDRHKGNDVAERHVVRRLHPAGLVLPGAGVTLRDLLLVVNPILVVRSSAGVEDPLLKAEIASCEILRQRIALQVARVAREVWHGSDDFASPLGDDLLRLILKDISCEPQIFHIRVGELR